jgi:hypothetical protein
MINEGDIINNLDFGTADQILSNSPNSPLSQLLLEITNELIAEMRFNLKDSRATGNLEQSILPTNIQANSVEITAPHYWKYINYGVNGTVINRGAPTHGPGINTGLSFHDAIEKWIKDKGIPIPNEMTIEGLAYAIQNSLVQKGQKATHFFDKVITPEKINEISKPISALLKQSIITLIKKPKK